MRSGATAKYGMAMRGEGTEKNGKPMEQNCVVKERQSGVVRRCSRESCRDGIELYCVGIEGLKSAYRTQKGERR